MSYNINNDSDVTACNQNGFESTGRCLQYRLNGRTSFRRLYTVSDDTRKWDLGDDWVVPAGWKLMATGSYTGQYCYILIRKVGKVMTSVAGGCRSGLRHRFVFLSEHLGNVDGASLSAPDAGIVTDDDYWHDSYAR